MTLRKLFLTLVLVAAGSAAASRANAQCGYGGGYGGWGGWGAWDAGRLYGVLADRVPYYSAFPPVYYSMPVPRTYGYSPFAYPPGVMTPEVEVAPTPLSITNPYVGQGAKTASEPAKAAPKDRTTQAKPAAGPLVVINPYVQQSSAPATQTAVLAR